MPDNTFRNLIRFHTRATRVGKFGQFKFALKAFQFAPPLENDIAPGESVVFSFAISGSGPFADTDFTSEVSQNPPGNTPSRAAAKFVNGPNGDSAFGATQTDPVSGLLTLSEQSSDSTPAADLDATLDFSVSGTDLFLTVTNTSALPNAFNINEIYWNAANNVSDLSFNRVFGWTFVSSL